MKGFSFIEMMIGLAIAAILFLGLIRFSKHTSDQYLTWRRHQEAQTNLWTARTALRRFTAMHEPTFWQAFPLAAAPVHPVDHTHHGRQFSKACPQVERGGCQVFWDLQPPRNKPTPYQIVDQEWPLWFHPTPTEEGLPIGPGEEFQPESIVLIQAGTKMWPALIAEVNGDEVHLVPAHSQPWPIPEYLPADEAVKVIVLARLKMTHILLSPSPQRHFTLKYQPWHWIDDVWKPTRSKTGDTLLVDLIFSPCQPGTPDRIDLVCQPRNPHPLPMPLKIGVHSYSEEVFYATLAF